ncbi:MAG: glycosyltransferase [Lentisphaeria bacterium]|nr:glycosyltransferase [Lentisphaeria bacterium]MDY0175637.1 glycosyltransferase [Lentisphaeria bacterium]
MDICNGIMHVFGHPELPLDLGAFPENAQLQTSWHFCTLLLRLGIPCIYYGLSGSCPPAGVEFVSLGKALSRWRYGNAWHQTYSRRCSRALKKNLCGDERPQWLASLYGAAQADIAACGLPVIEPMLGYDHCWAPYRVFPSYAHQQSIYNLQPEFTSQNRYFDTVIPHFVDPADYPLQEQSRGYLLYLGRDAADKGVDIAKECAEAAGLPLKLAHKGYHGRAKAELIGGAIALLMPTLYLEPFGYVAIEAQMCGVPVVCSDWGAFPETVQQGRDGFRCRTQAEFLKAIKDCGKLERKEISRRARMRFSYDAVSQKYARYFAFVWNVHNNGGYYAKDARR